MAMVMMKNPKKILTKKFLIKEYIINKKSMLIIAKENKCAIGTIWNYLKTLKVKTRTLSEALSGKKASNYIDGRSLKSNFCLNCGNKIGYRAKRCKICAHIKHGKYCQKVINKLYYCKSCGNIINWQSAIYGSGMCIKCVRKGKNNPMYGVHRFGKNNPNFKYGNFIKLYPITWTKALKESIRIRDNHQCQICGKSTKKNSRKLDVHHIDYDKNNLNPENLTGLCRSCHVQTNGNKDIYMEYFKVLLNIL